MVKQTLALLTLAVFLLTTPTHATEVSISNSSSTEVQWKYPPIRLELAEASLNPEEKKAKTELVQGSEVFETRLHSYGMVYEDAALVKKLEGLIAVEDLGEKAKGFKYRIFILKDPQLNAMTTPSGSIYINSGLLAALENFDQLRLVIGHEVHHILDQDIVHGFNKIKRETGTIKVLQIIAAPAVAVAIGQSDSDTGRLIANAYTAGNLAVNISYNLSVAGYGREDENQCDQFALNIFKTRHYGLDSAHGVFMVMASEEEKYSQGIHTHLFSDHDSGRDRAERVEKLMKEVNYKASEKTEKVDDGYDVLTRGIRVENARLNVKLGRIQHALDDLKRLNEKFPGDAEILNLFGDAYAAMFVTPELLREELSRKEWRKLNIEDPKKHAPIWGEQAKQYYERAITANPLFADAYRGKALLEEKQEAYSQAISHYQRYLELKTSAEDKRYIKAKIERLIKKQAAPSVPKK